MIKKTYYIENPARLSLKLDQLDINSSVSEEAVTRNLDDAGMIILDHAQISLTLPLLRSCAEKNVAITICDESHLPSGIFIPMSGHTESGGRMRSQVESSKPLRKQIWQKTVAAKIYNQAMVLKAYGLSYQPLIHTMPKVRSGDTSNIEGTAAAYYWKHLFQGELDFRRDRFGSEPNAMLNYSYAILRSLTAKSIIGAGLTPFMGIHHKNIYNSLCLADDIMEPFRPFADARVKMYIDENPKLLCEHELSKSMRQYLLGILNTDVRLEDQLRPLQVSMQIVCAKLARCFEDDTVSPLIYPVYE